MVTIKQVIEMVENEDSSVFVGSVWELKDAFIVSGK